MPEQVDLDAVDEAWARACTRNPRLFDGPVWHVGGVSRNGHSGVTLHLIEASYRFHAVRAQGLETGIRPLGVKALTLHEGRVLLGRRSPCVHAEPGRWEFIPGGSLEPGVRPADALEAELREEASWRAVAPPVAIALLFDDHTMTWEIVHRMEARPTEAGGDGRCSWEHDEILACEPDAIAVRDLSRAARLMLPLVEPSRSRAKSNGPVQKIVTPTISPDERAPGSEHPPR